MSRNSLSIRCLWPGHNRWRGVARFNFGGSTGRICVAARAYRPAPRSILGGSAWGASSGVSIFRSCPARRQSVADTPVNSAVEASSLLVGSSLAFVLQRKSGPARLGQSGRLWCRTWRRPPERQPCRSLCEGSLGLDALASSSLDPWRRSAGPGNTYLVEAAHDATHRFP